MPALNFVLPSMNAFALTGNRWNQQPEDAQAFYILGVVDAWGEAALYERVSGETNGVYSQLIKCLEKNMNMNGHQVVAIVNKFMKEVPEQWNHTMALIGTNAILEACHITAESIKK